MECAVENNYVCFHCGVSFRLEFFSEVLICPQCSLEAAEHRRNLTLLKPEVEVFACSGAQSFVPGENATEEVDNVLLKKFVLRILFNMRVNL